MEPIPPYLPAFLRSVARLHAADRLQALAGMLEAAADELRGRARVLGLQTAGLQWRSPAAREFGAQVDELTVGLAAAAARLAALGAEVRDSAAGLARPGG